MQEGECAGINPDMLGDVVISADTALAEAEAAGSTLHERLVFLLLHGILHLCGYDHERSGEQEAKRMVAKERQLFTLLKSEGFA
jgi:probable rRNA maturation factor